MYYMPYTKYSMPSISDTSYHIPIFCVIYYIPFTLALYHIQISYPIRGLLIKSQALPFARHLRGALAGLPGPGATPGPGAGAQAARACSRVRYLGYLKGI